MLSECVARAAAADAAALAAGTVAAVAVAWAAAAVAATLAAGTIAAVTAARVAAVVVAALAAGIDATVAAAGPKTLSGTLQLGRADTTLHQPNFWVGELNSHRLRRSNKTQEFTLNPKPIPPCQCASAANAHVPTIANSCTEKT